MDVVVVDGLSFDLVVCSYLSDFGECCCQVVDSVPPSCTS